MINGPKRVEKIMACANNPVKSAVKDANVRILNLKSKISKQTAHINWDAQ